MSYNSYPTWVNVDISYLKRVAKCKFCYEPFGNFKSVVSCLLESDYYTARHIPPSLTFNCSNENCPFCDEEQTIKIKAVILPE